jgi:hypothetical protein
MNKEMTLEGLKKRQPDLINAFLRDHSQAEAVRVANKILIDLDNLTQLEERYIVKRTNGHFDVQKNHNQLAERVRANVRSMAALL